jgi:UDP-glucose 4-epimerase
MSQRPAVLVTGGAGFIGSHLVDSLASEGLHVRVLDDLSAGKRENLTQAGSAVELMQADLRDEWALANACRGVEVVFHLGARVSVPESFEQPELYESVCGDGTRRLVEAAQRAGVRRLVYAGSSSAYGNPATQPVSERAPLDPLSPYAVAKLAGEEHCRLASSSSRLETVRLRFFNVYGQRQDASSPYSGVISKFLDLAERGQAPTIYGDGSQTRDFVHVSDVVRALRLAAHARGANGGCFNVGRGIATTLRELAASVGLATGCMLRPHFGPERVGDVRHSCADPTLARSQLGFAARVPLGVGLRRTRRLEALALPAA